MNKFGMALAFAAAVAATPCAMAQDRIGDATDMQALRAAVKADKRAYVASALNLTDAEKTQLQEIEQSLRDLHQQIQDRKMALLTSEQKAELQKRFGERGRRE